MTSYRKLRKIYLRKFGYTFHYTLYEKEHQIMKKASKKVTAILMRMALSRGKSIVEIIGKEIKNSREHEDK